MKKIPLVLLAVIVLSIPSVPLADADTGSVRLTGVMPSSSFEGIEITNYGSTLNLKDCSVSDGEGIISFSENIYLLTNQSVWILKSEPAEWFACEKCLLFGTNGISSKKFALNDRGDDVYLSFKGKVVDTFVYGNIEEKCEGWIGNPFQKLTNNSYAKRTNYFDTDSESDWSKTIPGTTEYQEVGEIEECLVTPFVFPESKGFPVMQTLLEAEKEVDISIYTLSQYDVVGILLRLLNKGIAVNILCEGNPIGGINESELKALSTLEKNGADVRLILKDADDFKRYDYLHNKYAVIDCEKVILTSENWVDSSFSGNRGWGAIIESKDYAWMMKDVFLNDFCFDNTDIKKFSEVYDGIKSGNYTCSDSYSFDCETFECSMQPILSPDNSEDTLLDYLYSAEYRIFAEELDIQYNWIFQEENPLSILREKGNDGLDSRIILDVTFDSREDEDEEDNWGIIDFLNDEGFVRAKKISGDYSVVHNKGIIVDDKIWLGSVNWTNNSLRDNRETAVIFYSSDITSFFEEYYLEDWGLEPSEIEIKIKAKGEANMNSVIVLDASESRVNPDSSFFWDLDSDGLFEKEGKMVLLKIDKNRCCVKVKMEDEEGNVVVADYFVTANAEKTMYDLKYVPLVVLCAIILTTYAYKKLRGKNAD